MQASEELVAEHFADGVHQDMSALGKAATLDERKARGWSLNSGRYVSGPQREEDDDLDIDARLIELHDGAEGLNPGARWLEGQISENMVSLLSRRTLNDEGEG